MTDSQYLALIAVDYVDKVSTCLQCTLLGTESCLDTKCLSSQRDDGRDVIFVDKETNVK